MRFQAKPSLPLALAAAMVLLSSLALPGALGQAVQPPRVTGQADAQGAEVVINQIETTRYPRVSLFATVLRGGQPVRGLTAASFRVRQEEVDQEPLTVEPRQAPLYAAVVLDTSGSMRARLPEAKAAAGAFIDALGAQDRVRAFSFAREVRALNGPGAERAAAKAVLNGTAARGDTALYDALYAGIEATKEQPGRKAVVLLSDGVDDDGTGKQLSRRSLSEALELARTVNVPVYTIGLGNEIDDGILRRTADETGGQYFKAPEASQLRALYARIAEQLSGQYTIGYESNLPADGEEHRVRLTVLGADGASGTKVFRAPRGPQAASSTASAPPTAASGGQAAATAEGRTTGGASFDTAVRIEPGRGYRLQDHLAKSEFAYFAFEAQPGQTVAASIRTGSKGVTVSNNLFREGSNPYGGLRLVSPTQEMIGKAVDVISDPLRKEGIQFRVPAGRGGTYYLVVGSTYNPQHADTEFMAEVSEPTGGATGGTVPRGSGEPMLLPPPDSEVARVNGGASFDAATPVELGRAYRLNDHLAKNEVAYFSVEVPAGKVLLATVHTGMVGVAIDGNGVVRETTNPYAGIALATSDQRLIGERQNVISDELKRAGVRYRPAGGRGGRVYLLVGSEYNAMHRDTRITAQVVD